MEYYSAITKNEILPLATWMDLESILLSDISQMEKDGLCNCTHLWNLRNKTKTSSQILSCIVSDGNYTCGRDHTVVCTDVKVYCSTAKTSILKKERISRGVAFAGNVVTEGQ